MKRVSWICRCDLTNQDALVFSEDNEAHVMERVDDTDVYICYRVDEANRTILVERIRTLEGESAPTGGKVWHP